MSTRIAAAPAKINLHLEVLGRRVDGFHGLETIFQTIGLADRVEVDLEPAGADGDPIALTCSDPTLPNGPGNLAWRAAEAVLALHPAVGRVRIHLEKHVPHGAGLGGGSSDAAAVLRVLARLLSWDDPPALHRIALALGSDVPFFLVGGTAHALGRGEELTALPDLTDRPITVLMPAGAHLPTPAVFRELTDAERGPREPRGADWWRGRLASGFDPAACINRLALPASRLCPPVAALLAWLERQGVPHLMTGSGAACVAFTHLDPPAGVRAWRTHLRPRCDLDSVLAPG